MAIFLVYSTSGITSDKKVCRELKMVAILKILKYETQLQFDLRYEKIVPNYAKKCIFMMMTSSMTSQGGLKVGPLYSFINEITTFFMITKKRAKISSLNFLCIGIMRLWLQLYKYIHDVIDDVTRSQNRSNFKIDVSPSIFELERRSQAQNFGNAQGYLSGIFNFRYNFQ